MGILSRFGRKKEVKQNELDAPSPHRLNQSENDGNSVMSNERSLVDAPNHNRIGVAFSLSSTPFKVFYKSYKGGTLSIKETIIEKKFSNLSREISIADNLLYDLKRSNSIEDDNSDSGSDVNEREDEAQEQAPSLLYKTKANVDEINGKMRILNNKLKKIELEKQVNKQEKDALKEEWSSAPISTKVASSVGAAGIAVRTGVVGVSFGAAAVAVVGVSPLIGAGYLIYRGNEKIQNSEFNKNRQAKRSAKNAKYAARKEEYQIQKNTKSARKSRAKFSSYMNRMGVLGITDAQLDGATVPQHTKYRNFMANFKGAHVIRNLPLFGLSDKYGNNKPEKKSSTTKFSLNFKSLVSRRKSSQNTPDEIIPTPWGGISFQMRGALDGNVQGYTDEDNSNPALIGVRPRGSSTEQAVGITQINPERVSEPSLPRRVSSSTMRSEFTNGNNNTEAEAEAEIGIMQERVTGYRANTTLNSVSEDLGDGARSIIRSASPSNDREITTGIRPSVFREDMS